MDAPNADLTSLRTEIAALGPSLAGDVLLEDSPGYDDARIVWNAMIDRRPAAIVRCRTIGDVIAAVQLASRHDVPMSIRAGGHNVAGHALGDGAVTLDLTGMRGVAVDPGARRAVVDGGATWADVDAATQAYGLATPGGLISETGVGGLTLSGGVGWLRSAYGLSIDNLLAADVVLADGRLVRASGRENEDLFWALRGGGGNFGVVVRFELALHPVGPTVMFCAPIYPLSAGSGPIRFWRDFLADKHDRIGSLVEFSTIPQSADFPQRYWGQRCYTIACVFAGDPNEGERVMQPLRKQGQLAADFSGQMDYCDVQRLFDQLMPTGQFRCYWKSHFLKELTDAAIDEAIENAAASPSDNMLSSIWNFGGATAQVPAEETAFGARDFGWMYSLDMVWSDAPDDKQMIDWTRKAWERARAHAHDRRLYLNFAGQDDDSAELTRNAFGRNYARLAQIKRTYDPRNLFRFNQNIEPGGK